VPIALVSNVLLATTILPISHDKLKKFLRAYYINKSSPILKCFHLIAGY
jgi:hypothetical protein